MSLFICLFITKNLIRLTWLSHHCCYCSDIRIKRTLAFPNLLEKQSMFGNHVVIEPCHNSVKHIYIYYQNMTRTYFLEKAWLDNPLTIFCSIVISLQFQSMPNSVTLVSISKSLDRNKQLNF